MLKDRKFVRFMVKWIQNIKNIIIKMHKVGQPKDL